jgi:hypothetical protein
MTILDRMRKWAAGGIVRHLENENARLRRELDGVRGALEQMRRDDLNRKAARTMLRLTTKRRNPR